MRLAIVGQQAFGKAALDAFLERGDDVAGVFVAPEPAGARGPTRCARSGTGEGHRMLSVEEYRLSRRR